MDALRSYLQFPPCPQCGRLVGGLVAVDCGSGCCPRCGLGWRAVFAVRGVTESREEMLDGSIHLVFATAPRGQLVVVWDTCERKLDDSEVTVLEGLMEDPPHSTPCTRYYRTGGLPGRSLLPNGCVMVDHT